MSNRTDRRAGRGGFTLVEIVTAMAIIAIAGGILLAGFGTSLGIIGRSAEREQAVGRAYLSAETAQAGEPAAVQFSPRGSGRVYTVPGQLVTGAQAVPGQHAVAFYAFVPQREGRP